MAHALKRELLRAGLRHALAGTLFVTPALAARAVLDAAGVAYSTGEATLRPSRLSALFETPLSLRHFSLELLRSRPGWDEAFALTIGDLESAGFEPDDLAGVDDVEPDVRARLADVASLWRSVSVSAGESLSEAGILRRAAEQLAARPALWPFEGACLVTVSGHETAAEAQCLRAIPGGTLAVLAARPVRPHHLERVEGLFGRDVAGALAAATAPRTAGSELEIVRSYVFEAPAVLASHDRPRSSGPDGTVALEEHAGVEAEIEAAAAWVASRVLDGTALEDVAVLVPELDPLAGLVADRLARLPWHDGTLPVHVAGGLPLSGTAAGARALAVVRALEAHLSADAVASVLPVLRADPADTRHLSRGSATELAWSLGTVGGNAARKEGALEWATRAVEREAELEAQLAVARAAADDPEQSGLARSARDLERTLADLRAVRPALLALVEISRLVIGGTALATLWPALRTFLEQWLLQPGGGPPAHTLLDAALAGYASDAVCAALAGDDALAIIGHAAVTARVPVGRFGEPAVSIGTLSSAVGIELGSVRIIGLAEGHVPGVPREDPVIPDALRRRLARRPSRNRVAPRTGADRALASLHALDHVIRNVRDQIVLSAPRVDIERSLREPSSIILEAAAALGRPDTMTGQRVRVIPDRAALERDAFIPARDAALAFRRLNPVGEVAWQDGAAARVLDIPSAWRGSLALDLDRIRSLRDGSAPPALDGLLGPAATDVPVPGLSADWPISPSLLRSFLQCPHLVLLGTLLGFEEPAGAPAQREIGQPAYGSLVHRAAEQFYRAHGEDFGARERALETWLARADDVVERVFAEFLHQYPLAGPAVRNKERERLRADVHELLEHDWNGGTPRRFVAVERSFGRPTPIRLHAGRRSLYVRGQIDRIDVEGQVALVRDVKTGRAHPRFGREASPDPVLDVQIAVYGLVAQQRAGDWHLPAHVAAAYTYVGRGADERSWRSDFTQVLEPAAREWLAVASGLLAERSFPRTTNGADCTYCGFRPVCGDDAPARAAHVLQGASGALARFKTLKSPERED